MKFLRFLAIAFAITTVTAAFAQTRTATLTLDFTKNLGPAEMNHISLGQGGLSPDPIWDNRIAGSARFTHA